MKNYQSKGQAMITLLFIIIIAITLGASAAVVSSLNSRSGQRFADGSLAYYVAESGTENAMMRLLRDPTYTGETLQVGDGTAIITVTGSTTKTITSIGRIDNYQRTIQTIVGYSNGIFTVTSWKEIQ